MHSLDFLSNLIGQYGLYAVFVLAMIEGDITLLLAGVLAHSHFFGDYSFAQVLFWGTLGGVVSDNLAYFGGRVCGQTVRDLRFYRIAQPRIQRLTDTFGGLSIFLSKYIYGLRWASSIFHGVARMSYARFFLLSLGSCFVWVFVLSGAGYFFSGAVMGVIGDFQRLGKILLVIVVVGIVGFYLAERLWLSKKVEDVNPDLIQGFEHAAQEKVQELRDRMPFRPHHQRHKEGEPRSGTKPGDVDGD
jgi:membrane protein DedA with SNARE-associated domain